MIVSRPNPSQCTITMSKKTPSPDLKLPYFSRYYSHMYKKIKRKNQHKYRLHFKLSLLASYEQ